MFGNGVKSKIKEELLKRCSLHTIIRLPNGVFNPYTTIKTNLLFFEKGKPTKEIWYYDMPLPADIKNFNRNRSISIGDFDLIKRWWNNRIINEYAWKVNIDSIKERGYDLDFKNPNIDINERNEPMLSAAELIEEIEKSVKKSIELINEMKKTLL